MESSKIKYAEVIENTLNELAIEKEKITVQDVIDKLRNDIVQSYTPSCLITFKRSWLLRIDGIAKIKGFNLIKNKLIWEEISEDILTKFVNKNVSSGSTSTTSSTTSINSSTTNIVKAIVNQSDKETIINTFSSLDRTKMWTLSTGTIVELKMEELSKKSNYDHPSHSLIFDPEDVTWKDYFTNQELDEIRSYGDPTFESVPVSNIIANLNNKSFLEMHEFVSTQNVNPLTDIYNYWTKKSVTEGLDILLSNKLHSNIDSEDEIIDRIWKLIPWAFDQGLIVAKREQTSEVSGEQMNQRRKLSSVDRIDHQKTGKRIDTLFKYDGFELGVYEARKSSKEYSDAVISDEQIKVPKIMKGMLTKLLTVTPTKLRQIETVGIITNGLKIKTLIMDCPGGYVCRIRRAEAVRYPSTEGLFIKLIKKCLSLIWCSRLTMEKTIKTISEFDDEENCELNVKLTPCFYVSDNDNKSQKKEKGKGKRKHEET